MNTTTTPPAPNCGSNVGTGATVTHPDGSLTRVKNLGWILRHRDTLVAVNFAPLTRPGRWPAEDAGGIMTADFEGGRFYRCQWGSETVFRQWAIRYLKHARVTYI